MQHQIEVPKKEYTSVVARLRGEGRDEGEERGRMALLRMAEQLGLAMPELRQITSIDELEARVFAALREGR